MQVKTLACLHDSLDYSITLNPDSLSLIMQGYGYPKYLVGTHPKKLYSVHLAAPRLKTHVSCFLPFFMMIPLLASCLTAVSNRL